MTPRVLLSPLGGAAVQVRDCSFRPGESGWIEVRWNYDDGGVQIKSYSDEDVADWPEYGRPS
jgi:hypothetical protein